MADYEYGAYKQKTSGAGGASFRAFQAYTITETNTTYTLTLFAGLQCNTGAQIGTSGFSISVTGTGQTTKSKTNQTYYTSQGDSSHRKTLISTWDWTWNKGTTDQSKTVKCTVSASSMSASTATYTFTVPALYTYTVEYNANGGTLPSELQTPQTKYEGIDLTLRTEIPTRTGYNFSNWYANQIGGLVAVYEPGDTFSSDQDVVLYAQWAKKSSTITYNANGGIGSIANQTKYYDTALTLSNGSGFSRRNYSLVKWNTAADGSGTDYALSQQLSTTFLSNLNLYAQWHLDYTKPIINSVQAYRVASAGSTTEADEGERIYVNISYTKGTYEGVAVPVKCKIVIDNDTSHPVINTVISDNPFSDDYGTYSKDSSHSVVITLYDDYDSTGVSTTVSIPTATYPIDLVGNGNDVYMGIMNPAVTGQGITVGQDMYFKINSSYRSLLTQLLPIGRIDMYAGAVAPTGWLLCDGSAISRTAYASLFAVIGTTYGTGDGSTTFNVPDMRNRFPVGAGDDYNRNDKGGSSTVALTTDELPSHTHGEKELVGTFRYRKWGTGSLFSGMTGIISQQEVTTTANNVPSSTNSQKMYQVTIDATHEHDSVGLGAAHENRPPYIGVNFIIYAGA